MLQSLLCFAFHTPLFEYCTEVCSNSWMVTGPALNVTSCIQHMLYACCRLRSPQQLIGAIFDYRLTAADAGEPCRLLTNQSCRPNTAKQWSRPTDASVLTSAIHQRKTKADSLLQTVLTKMSRKQRNMAPEDTESLGKWVGSIQQQGVFKIWLRTVSK